MRGNDPWATAIAVLAMILAGVGLNVAVHATRPTSTDRLASCRSAIAVRPIRVDTVPTSDGTPNGTISEAAIILAPYPAGALPPPGARFLVAVDPACVEAITGHRPTGAQGPTAGPLAAPNP